VNELLSLRSRLKLTRKELADAVAKDNKHNPKLANMPMDKIVREIFAVEIGEIIDHDLYVAIYEKLNELNRNANPT